jgi:3-oxocholest-4-en-26-oyl-CoA dehydrogenase beta subunit
VDFTLDEQQTVVRDLARQILGDRASVERHRELESAGEWFDRDAWQALADAGLLGVAVPEAFGGLGLGFVETALVLEEQGRTVAKIPYLGTAVAGAALAAHGPAALAERWLGPVVTGEAVLATALADAPGAVRASADDVLDGQVSFVAGGLWAALVLVPATTVDGAVAVFAVEPSSEGVTVERQGTSTGAPEARLTLTSARGTLVGTPGDDVAEWLRQRTVAGLCALAAGITAAALELTATYVRGREQFGKALATFQAVGQRAADAYIDTKAIGLTARQAAWRLAAGEPATAEVAVAKFWASEGGQRVLEAAQHLHGGMGVDRDYPLHRYFLAARSIDLTLGAATEQLIRLGDELADAPI